MNIMIIVRLFPVLAMALMLWLGISCTGSKDNSNNDIGDGVMTDSQMIQAAFTEAATRWHYGDKAVLYDMEFGYYKAQYSYDDYLAHPTIIQMSADSLDSIIVIAVEQFGDDSAHVDAEIVFTGPAGIKTRFNEGVPFLFYKRDGRWFHPTLSNITDQLEFDELIEAANSAADDESDLDDE